MSKREAELEAELAAIRQQGADADAAAPKADTPTNPDLERLHARKAEIEAEKKEKIEDFQAYATGLQKRFDEKRQAHSDELNGLDTQIAEIDGAIKFLEGTL